MVRDIKGDMNVARTFSEFSLLSDGLTTEACTIEKVSLETVLAGLRLKIPLIAAAMMSVMNNEIGLELGRRGGIGILPNNLSVDEQSGIVRRFKDYEIEFVEDPVRVNDNATIWQVLEKLEQHGHSTIPVVDRFQHFLGMFTQARYWESGKGVDAKVTDVMVPYRKGTNLIEICQDPSMPIAKVKEMLKKIKGKHIVFLDEQGRLVKLAFKQDIEEIKIGAAISTHEGWKERVIANIEAGVDLVVIDTSDGYSEFAGKVVEEYKKDFEGVPICAGNVVTYNGAMYLMERGADIVKLGMSSGSICTTRREKAVGRAPMAALLDCARARDDFKEREVPLIWDGGAKCAADFNIGLTEAHAVMAGGYFNRFFEAAGEKYDQKGNPTDDEMQMAYVATWGEGSARARNMDRYGQSRRTFFTEGEEGRIPYEGRMKPNLETDLNKIKAALSNAGCKNLKEFREKSVLEVMSPAAQGIVGDIHTISVHKK